MKLEDVIIPVEKVLDDMYNPDGGLVAMAARDYYYTYYATPDQKVKMDKEEKRQKVYTCLFEIGILIFVAIGIIWGCSR